jgi:thiamine-phosphate pyrophosphorylase
MAPRRLVYYITDRSQFNGNEQARRRALSAKVTEAARAGVDYIQLRENDLSARELESLAREVVGFVREYSQSTRVLINSRTDVALATGAGGLHLRAEDIAPDEVRSIVKLSSRQPAPDSNLLVSVSCHSVADVFRAESSGADLAVFAPVFGKSAAPGIQPAGLGMLREACHAKLPVLALGGVTLENAASCVNAGAAGIAGIRLFQTNRIEDVVRAMRDLRLVL